MVNNPSAVWRNARVEFAAAIGYLLQIASVRIHLPQVLVAAPMQVKDNETSIRGHLRMKAHALIRRQLLLVRAVRVHRPEVEVSAGLGAINQFPVRGPYNAVPNLRSRRDLRGARGVVVRRNPDVGYVAGPYSYQSVAAGRGARANVIVQVVSQALR